MGVQFKQRRPAGMWILERLLRGLVRRGQLTIVYVSGRTVTFGDSSSGEAFTLRFHDRSVPIDIVRNPELGLPEAFMDGHITIVGGDIMDFLAFVRANNPWESGREIAPEGTARRLAGRAAKALGKLNDRRRARRNVAHHYELSGALYALFLDRDRQYSCAYFTDPHNSLEQAQEDKKAHIAAKLALRPGHRVLDIGCGWGGMALYLHARTGADVLGVTLSEEQLGVARRRAVEAGVADHVRFELIDYRDVRGPFDRIVSVGMFEHVGARQYREFFRTCHNLLTPDGVMLLHTIGRADGPNATDAFTEKYIFPGGYIPALSEVMAASEPNRLMLTDVEILRMHYALTLRQWYARTVANRAQIEALYDARFFRMWTFYLAGAAISFENGALVNYQLQYSRSRLALPITRTYMGAAEQVLSTGGTPNSP